MRWIVYALALFVCTVYLPFEAEEFEAGSDAWEALNAGKVVILDETGFILNPSALEICDSFSLSCGPGSCP